MRKGKQGYFLQEDLLLRMWAPHGETFSGEPMVQIVLPSAHDNVAGHIGVRKTYHRVLKHFF